MGRVPKGEDFIFPLTDVFGIAPPAAELGVDALLQVWIDAHIDIHPAILLANRLEVCAVRYYG